MATTIDYSPTLYRIEKGGLYYLDELPGMDDETFQKVWIRGEDIVNSSLFTIRRPSTKEEATFVLEGWVGEKKLLKCIYSTFN